MKVLMVLFLVAAAGITLAAQRAVGLDPAKLLNPGTDSWPTYNGDYSGRRYSPLAQINTANVKALSLAWIYQIEQTNKQGRVDSPWRARADVDIELTGKRGQILPERQARTQRRLDIGHQQRGAHALA